MWWGRAWLSPVTAPPATPTPGTGPHSSSGTRTRPSSPSTGQSASLLLFILLIHNSGVKLSYYHYPYPFFLSCLGHFPFGWWVSSLTFKVHGLDTAKMLIFVLLSPLQLNKWVYKHDKDIKYVESVLLEYKCRFLQSSF